MSVKLERESQEREEAMQQIREQEAKLNEAKAKVRLVVCSALTPAMKQNKPHHCTSPILFNFDKLVQ